VEQHAHVVSHAHLARAPHDLARGRSREAVAPAQHGEGRERVEPAEGRAQAMLRLRERVAGLAPHPRVQPLQPVATATTVRVRNGKVSVTDGPFAETKECLAGFYMVEARDLNEAIQIASRIPPAQIGSIEVRPIRPIREAPNAHKARGA